MPQINKETRLFWVEKTYKNATVNILVQNASESFIKIIALNVVLKMRFN